MSCNKSMSFEECERAILKKAIEESKRKQGKKMLMNDETLKIINIVESFIKDKKCICYGGTAINNILPEEDQFYDKQVEFPDYDFYTPHALKYAKELADIYYKHGFTEVEAKAGVHKGTFKVYVNFLPVADITFLPLDLYKELLKDSKKVENIYYAPPNFLRMSMYLELSRPDGDTSRWEKVLKRITLLNKHYPLKGKQCTLKNIQRIFSKSEIKSVDVFTIIRDTFVNNNVVFFGSYALKLYSRYMPKKIEENFRKIPDFDVLAEDPELMAYRLKEQLNYGGYKNVEIIKHEGVGEIISDHIEIKVEDKTVVFIYKPIACHSYNIADTKIGKIRIATIDTMLSFYLAFMYANREYYKKNRILCMCEFLFNVQQENRLEQKGLLKRFSIECYGKQHTLEESRKEKSEKYKEFKNKKNTTEYEEYFLRYVPFEIKKDDEIRRETLRKSKTKPKQLSTKQVSTKQVSTKLQNLSKPKTRTKTNSKTIEYTVVPKKKTRKKKKPKKKPKKKKGVLGFLFD